MAVILVTVLLCLAVPALSLAQQPKPRSPAAGTVTRQDDAQAERISPVMLLDRVAQLEATNKGMNQRLDDSRNLTLTLFGGLVALLAAIGVPVIFRERRELRELRDLGVLEGEKITSQLRQALVQIEAQIATVRAQLTSETETLRKGLVDNLRAQMSTMQQQFESTITAQKTELLEAAPPEIAKQAMARVEAQLQTYAQTLQSLNAQPLASDHVLRANFYLAQSGDQNAAVAAVSEARRALELDGKNVDALVALVQGLSRLGQAEEAWSHLMRAAETAPHTTKLLVEIVATALQLQRFDDVLQWTRLLERQADFSNRVWLVNSQATALKRLGQIRDAIRVLSDFLSDEPQVSLIRAQLAETLLDAQLFDEAERITTEGLTLNPTDHQLTVLRARARFGADRAQDALDDLAVAERENPRDVKIFITRSRILTTLNDYDGAVAACRSGLGLRAPSMYRALLHVNLAQALLRLNQVTEALDAAEQAVRLGHQYILNHLVLIQCLFCANRLPDVVLAADQAGKVIESVRTASAGGKVMVLLFTALAFLGIYGLSPKAEMAEEEFRGAAKGVSLTWDFHFLHRIVEARTDPPEVRERMLRLVE